jgi:glutamine amidotransferase
MRLAIVKYNAGNIRSVLYALERIGTEAVVTDDTAELQRADKVIFPGVGEASTAMKYLREKGLQNTLVNLERRYWESASVAVDVSLQRENDTDCLGILTKTKLLKPTQAKLKVPQLDGIISVSQVHF